VGAESPPGASRLKHPPGQVMWRRTVTCGAASPGYQRLTIKPYSFEETDENMNGLLSRQEYENAFTQ
jgi:hypothetical protein